MSGQRISVTSVKLDNYRGFAKEVTVALHPALTVFAGVNGSGKTSIMEALINLVSGIPFLFVGLNRSLGISTSDVGRYSDRVSIRLRVTDGSDDASWSLHRAFDDRLDRPEREATSFSFFSKLAGRQDDPLAIFPAIQCIHSGSTRMPVQRPYPVALNHPRLAAYQGCHDSEAHQFTELEDWFEQEENLENEHRIRKQNLGLTIPSLRAVRGAVEIFLSHLHDSRLRNLKVVRVHAKGPLEPASGKLAMDKDGQQLMLTQLSDGERRLVLMVADIARRMAILNPALADPLQSPGIILVDEIELHLHPLWQRTVVPALQAALPNVQLLLTTHSPQVLASVPDECVVILKDGQALPGHPRVRGRDTNTILEQVMDATARPPEVQARIDEVYARIDRHPDDARARLDALEAEFGADEPDLVRARAMMDFVGA